MISDWDGVFTSLKYHNNASTVQLKTYKDIDMTAIKCFKTMGVPFVILSGDSWNADICASRKIDFYNSRNKDGFLDKGEIILEICKKYNILPENTGYVGDDIFDIPAMKNVNFVFCPKDSSNFVLEYVNKKHRKYSKVLQRDGGNGCLDEIFWDFYELEMFEQKELDYKELVYIDKQQMVNK